MLWIYSENDHWFPPEMAKKFEAAYTKNGGVEQFMLAPPDGDDGHHLYSHPSVWSATVEEFLKAHDLLPLGDVVLPAPEPAKIPPPAGLPDKGQEAWKRYLLGGPFKAFAINGQGQWGFAQGAFDQDIADSQAIDRCRQAAAGAGSCSVVATTTGREVELRAQGSGLRAQGSGLRAQNWTFPVPESGPRAPGAVVDSS